MNRRQPSFGSRYATKSPRKSVELDSFVVLRDIELEEYLGNESTLGRVVRVTDKAKAKRFPTPEAARKWLTENVDGEIWIVCKIGKPAPAPPRR